MKAIPFPFSSANTGDALYRQIPCDFYTIKAQLPWNRMHSQITFRFVGYTNSFT